MKNVCLFDFGWKLYHPSTNKRGDNDSHVSQILFKIGFIYKTLITFKLLFNLLFDYNVIQVTFLLRLMMK